MLHSFYFNFFFHFIGSIANLILLAMPLSFLIKILLLLRIEIMYKKKCRNTWNYKEPMGNYELSGKTFIFKLFFLEILA